MPRIRTVKPEFPKHRKVRAVSRDARLLNIHLWNLADDEGHLQELPQWIIGEVFPTDEDVTPAVLRGWLEELEQAGLIVRYEIDGERYIQCHDFRDHQRIEKPKASDLPPPPNGPAEPIHDSSGNDPGSVQDEPPVGREEEGKGNREGNGRARELAAVPPEFAPILQQLDRVGFSRNLPDLKVPAAVKACQDFDDRDLALEADKFAHYWIDGVGENRDLKDVAGAWRNWLRNAPSADAAKRRKPQTSPRSSVGEDLAKLEAEHAAAQAREAASA